MPDSSLQNLLDLDPEMRNILADALPIMVMISDADGVVSFFNKHWYSYTGQSRIERDTERDWQRYMHPSDGERVANDWLAAVRAGKDVVEMKYRLREAATGAYRWFQGSTIALKDDAGRIVQWLGAAMDIEAERQSHAEVSELYADAHTAATTLHRAHLPTSLPRIEGLEFEAIYLPRALNCGIGGDWYDAFTLPDRSIVISIGDVTGHGLEAAVLMGKIRYSMRVVALRAYGSYPGDVASVLCSVEEGLATEHPDSSATAFLGVISTDRQRMQYVSAGHPPPLLVGATGNATWLENGDMPLGCSFKQSRTKHDVDLTDAACLFLYTDGLIETTRDVIDGMARLQQTVQGDFARKDGYSISTIVETVASGRSDDDIAVLALIFRSVAAVTRDKKTAIKVSSTNGRAEIQQLA